MPLQQVLCIFLLIEQIKYLLCIAGGRVERKSANSSELNMAKNISKQIFGAVKRVLVSNSCMHLRS